MSMQKEKNNFFNLTVKVVIINDSKQVLVVKRPEDDDKGAGKYDLPGGGLEEGEDMIQGLKREISEELGIETEIGPMVYVFDFDKKYAKKVKIGEEKLLIGGKGLRFLAYYKGGEIKLSNEHQNFEWIDISKAADIFSDGEFEEDKKIAVLKAKEYLEMKEALDGWKRCMADFDNYRKRQLQERKEIIAFANTNLVLELIPVLDNFYASTNHIPEDQKDNGWVTGIMYIQKQLEKVLSDNGVLEMEIKIGDEFNPEIMEAVASSQETKDKKQETEDKKHTVKKIVLKGYKLDNRVIRAARVIVE